MKKLILLALVVILLPTVGQAYDLRDGDPGFIFTFVHDDEVTELIMGETWCDFLYAAHYYWLGQDPLSAVHQPSRHVCGRYIGRPGLDDHEHVCRLRQHGRRGCRRLLRHL